MRYHIAEDKWGWAERLTGLVLIILAFALAFWVLTAVVAEAGSAGPNDMPRMLVVTGKLQWVTCAGPCCCGTLATTYQGHWYEGTYCKWFRPLRDGQTVHGRVYLQTLYR